MNTFYASSKKRISTRIDLIRNETTLDIRNIAGILKPGRAIMNSGSFHFTLYSLTRRK